MASTLEVLNASTITFLQNPPMMSVYTTSYSLASSGAYVAVPFTNRSSSSGAISWSSGSNPTRVTISVPGTYAVNGTIVWPSSLGSTNNGRGHFRINGTTDSMFQFSTVTGSTGNFGAAASGLQVMNSGDYIELMANQASGGATIITAVMGIWLVSLATS